jgi:hypothetical protein
MYENMAKRDHGLGVSKSINVEIYCSFFYIFRKGNYSSHDSLQGADTVLPHGSILLKK